MINDNGKWDCKWKIEYIVTTYIDQGLDMDLNILNIKCVSVWWWLYVLSSA